MTAKITFIGAGNMASSLAGGLIAKGYQANAITMTDLNQDTLEANHKALGVNINTDNIDACQNAEVIVLAVKPQVMEQVVSPLKSIVEQNKPVVLSIAAGITLNNLQTWLSDDTPLVRCMPNTPALVQAGASGLFANKQVNQAQRALALSILSAVGLALWVESEDEIDAVTAVSGSGPAYYFLVMEAMINAGKTLGLSDNVAKQLTLQTALGAAQMALDSDVDTSELRKRVTSPGGTTEKAISILQQHQLEDTFAHALKGAYDRSKELASQ